MKKHHIIKLLLLFLLNVEIRSQLQRIITFEISRATWMKKARSLFLKTFKDIPQKKNSLKTINSINSVWKRGILSILHPKSITPLVTSLLSYFIQSPTQFYLMHRSDPKDIRNAVLGEFSSGYLGKAWKCSLFLKSNNCIQHHPLLQHKE